MTRREEIFEILKKERKSAQALANFFKTELVEIVEDLQHLAKSVRPTFDLRMIPACCLKCGFVFRERDKIKAPTKCPRCRSEWIQAPLFFIEKKAKM
jgi:predicted Zn-ribbon and HTH transcriptional regulator